MTKTAEKTQTLRKTLKPRNGGSTVINPEQQKEKSNGTLDKKSGSPRKD